MSSSGWTTGPDTPADDDLRRARIIIAGLAGEAGCREDLPGSSLDELVLSQVLGLNAAAKLNDDPGRSDEEYDAYAQRLWCEQVWRVTFAILDANREPFQQIVLHLHETGKVQGAKLRQVLAQVRSITT